MKLRIPFVAATLSVCSAGLTAQGAIVISEVMYDPAGGNEHEYVELYNSGSTAVDLTGYKIDDAVGSGGSASDPLTGSIPAGGTAVLIRVDGTRVRSNYENAWGSSINFIDGTSWPGFTNGGEQVTLLDASDAVVAQIFYESASPWPGSNDSASIYLKDVSLDPTDGSNWALSVAGVDGAYQGSSPRASDVGSPGVVPNPIPEPLSLALAGICCVALSMCRRR